MSVLNFLSSVLGHRDNKANIALAKDIALNENKKAIKELVENLKHKNQKIQGDCIKVLYETAYLKPQLIANYHQEFLELLSNKNNRMVWSGMIALSAIADLRAKELFASLDLILSTVEQGSVITIDCGVIILSKLNTHAAYFNTTNPLLMEQLWKCPVKQLPMYIETAMISINSKNKKAYQGLIEKRREECEKDSQIKRLDKALRKMASL